MSFWQVALSSGLLMSVVMLGLWARQTLTKFANAVDAFWALGFTLTAVLAHFLLGGGWAPRLWLVSGGLALWSLRLGLHLLRQRVWRVERDAAGLPVEDSRYASLRARFTQSGGSGQKGFFVVYQMQAVIVFLFSIPPLIAMSESTVGWRVGDVLGLLIFIIALGGETLADRQLGRFKADHANRGRTCRVGLWRYSRHPNYFFEWLHWWAYVAFGLGASYGAVTLLGPALMLLFLIRLTGVFPAERQSRKTRPDYAEYQRTTSMFIPWFPKQ